MVNSLEVVRVVCVLILVLVPRSFCFPDQGKWSFKVDNVSQHLFAVQKSLYKASTVSVKITCDPTNPANANMKVYVGWSLLKTPCFQEFLDVDMLTQEQLFNLLYGKHRLFEFGERYYDVLDEPATCFHVIDLKPHNLIQPITTAPTSMNITTQRPREKRVAENALSPPKPDSASVKNDARPANSTSSWTDPKNIEKILTTSSGPLAIVDRDGIYMLIVSVHSTENKTFSLQVDMSLKGSYGYLSAVDWPFLPFYGVMCGVYVLYAIGWLTVSALQWRDLLRIQFWIGGVIFLGMLEKAVFYAEYQSINSTGSSVQGAVLFAEVLSCLKRSLARLLVIIVSLGFGIVKPRLGPMLHRVIIVGAAYFIMASVEGCLRTLKPKNTPDRLLTLLGIGLALVDSGICWWIFSSLSQTTRTLRLRRNVIKLSLYRHFTNTLIFAVLASIVFMIWVTFDHRTVECLTDWKELWFDEGYWQLLFSVVLLVIMFLWRPTNNNQRYAFTPLLDAPDDEFDEDFLQPQNDAFEGMKMRSNKPGSQPTKEKHDNSAEDDLKWVEETIPSSLGETALPSLLDSDEEIMTARFERNKME